MIVITGTQSGLGKFFLKNIKNSEGITKKNHQSKLLKLRNKKINILIHCAFSKSNNLSESYESNIVFLRKVLELKINKFIFISSIYVSQLEQYEHLNFNDLIYTFSKKACEEIINKKHKNSLILRCSSFITPYSKKNNLFHLIKNDKNLSVTKTSTYNIINPYDLIKIINNSKYIQKTKGTFNICSKDNIKVHKMAQLSNFTKRFGYYRFVSKKVDTQNTYKIFDFLNKSSKENFIKTFNILNEK